VVDGIFVPAKIKLLTDLIQVESTVALLRKLSPNHKPRGAFFEAVRSHRDRGLALAAA
jgi:hypothetical protein